LKKPLVFFPSPSPSLLFFYYTRDKSFDSLCVKQTYTHMCMCVVFQRSFYLWYVYRRQRRVFPIIFLAFSRLIVVIDIWQRSWSSLLFCSYFAYCSGTMLSIAYQSQGKSRVFHEHAFIRSFYWLAFNSLYFDVKLSDRLNKTTSI